MCLLNSLSAHSRLIRVCVCAVRLTMALSADLTGATPDPLGGICTSPGKERISIRPFFWSKQGCWGGDTRPLRTRWHYAWNKNLTENNEGKEKTSNDYIFQFCVTSKNINLTYFGTNKFALIHSDMTACFTCLFPSLCQCSIYHSHFFHFDKDIWFRGELAFSANG